MAIRQTLFCDTNLLLDLCDPGRVHHADAVALVWYATSFDDEVRLVAAISSFKDMYYILSRLYRDERAARESVQGIMGVFVHPADMLASFGKQALLSDEPDFEDGLIRACAERSGATTIITRDDAAFKGSELAAMSAADYLASVGFDYSEVDY